MTSDSLDRPTSRGAAAVAVIASFVVGVGAVGASSVLSSAAARVLTALVLVAAGWGLSRLAADQDRPLARAIGVTVVRGIGTSLAVLGAYLLGLALLTASVPDSLGESGPSPTAVVLLVYGLPALALLALTVTTRLRAWAIGTGAVLPMLVVALMLVAAGAGTATVTITMLVVSVLLAGLLFRAPVTSAWGDVASAAAAMSASFAFGAGRSPFGSLGTTQLGGTTGEFTGSGLSTGAQLAVTGGALLVGVVVLLLAVPRRDLASGVLVGAIFATPPVLMQQDIGFGTWRSGTEAVLIAVPALVAAVALVALRSYRFRRVLAATLPTALPTSVPTVCPVPATHSHPTPPPDQSPGSPSARASAPDESVPPREPGSRDGSAFEVGESPLPSSASSPLAQAGPRDESAADAAGASQPRPAPRDEQHSASQAPLPGAEPAVLSDARSAAACAVVLAAAAVVFVVLAMPVLGWDLRLQGSIALLVLVGASALAYWLPDTAGAAASVVALLGLALASPWIRLLTGGFLASSTELQIVAGVLDLVAAAVLAWLLLRRHPRVSVFAASAYLLAGSLAAFLGSLLFNPVFQASQATPYLSAWEPVLIVALPLLLLAIPAAILAFGRWAAIGQAIGAVAIAAGGFLPMKVLVGELVDGLPGYALQASLTPLTPTDWLGASGALRTVTGPTLVAVIVMVIAAFVLATSLATRPCAPLAAAITLLLLSAVQASLLTALSEWSADEASALGWILGAAALVAALVALATTTAATKQPANPT